MPASPPDLVGKQRARERLEPSEGLRPVPWSFIAFIAILTTWGAGYIVYSPSDRASALGDHQGHVSPGQALPSPEVGIDGQLLFNGRCAPCHQSSGMGIPGVFPPLAGSEWVLGDERILARILLHGINGDIEVGTGHYHGVMPSWQAMSDAELAAVMNYVRTSWGNKGGAPITPEFVKAQRTASAAQSTPFSSGEELKSAN